MTISDVYRLTDDVRRVLSLPACLSRIEVIADVLRKIEVTKASINRGLLASPVHRLLVGRLDSLGRSLMQTSPSTFSEHVDLFPHTPSDYEDTPETDRLRRDISHLRNLEKRPDQFAPLAAHLEDINPDLFSCLTAHCLSSRNLDDILQRTKMDYLTLRLIYAVRAEETSLIKLILLLLKDVRLTIANTPLPTVADALHEELMLALHLVPLENRRGVGFHTPGIPIRIQAVTAYRSKMLVALGIPFVWQMVPV